MHLFGADGWRARYYPGGQFFAYSFDPQGNVIQRQNSGNTVGYTYDTASYEGYGHRGADYDTGGMTPAPDQDPAGFGGEYGYYTDQETGLLCLTHRYYDPGTGRFVTRDPSGYGGGINLYGFAGDNPINYADPNGTDVTIGPADDPLLSFGGPESVEGLKTGLAATGSALSFGAYNGGKYRGELGYGTSHTLAVVGREAAIQAATLGAGNAITAFRAARAARAAAAAPVVAQITLNRANGLAAQNVLQAIVGGGPRAFRTSLGMRFVDVLDNTNVAHEVKTGYTTLTPFIQRQILKDAELIRTGQVRGVVWNFFRSPTTGLRGANAAVLAELARHGITAIMR